MKGPVMRSTLQRDQVLEWRRFVGCRGVFEYYFHTASGDWRGRGRSVKEALENVEPANDEHVASLWGQAKSKGKSVEK